MTGLLNSAALPTPTGTAPLNGVGVPGTATPGGWTWDTKDPRTLAGIEAQKTGKPWSGWTNDQFKTANANSTDPWSSYGITKDQWYGAEGEQARRATQDSIHYNNGGIVPNMPSSPNTPIAPIGADGTLTGPSSGTTTSSTNGGAQTGSTTNTSTASGTTSGQTQSGSGVFNSTNGSTPAASNVAPTIAPVSSYTPISATAVNAQTRDNVVTPQATSQYQLNQMLQSGSPLMETSETYGKQQSNKNGLLHSTMGIEAAQAAMIKAATPFAQQDAQTNAAANQANATASNQAFLQDAQAGTSVNVGNANAQTAAAGATAANENENNRLAAQMAQQGGLANTDNAVKLQLQNIQSNTSMTLADKQAASQKVLADAENANRIALQNIQSNTSMSIADKQRASNELIAGNDNANKLIMQSIDNVAKLGIATLDNDSKMALAKLDTQSRMDIAKSAQDNQQLLQANITAGNLFNQYLKNIADIGNSTMGYDAKQVAIKNQISGLNSSLQAIGEVSKLDLSKYFQEETNSDNTAPPNPKVYDQNGNEIDYDPSGIPNGPIPTF